MDAHLVLQGAAGHAVAGAEGPVGVHQHLRHDEERDPLGAGGRALDPREDEVHDVLGEVVLPGGDEDLGAGDAVGAVAVGHGLALEEPEIRAAMRLGEVHGAGPGPLDHARQVDRLLLLGAVDQERGHRALGQAGIHPEGEVRPRGEFLDRRVEGMRQALTAVGLGHGEAHPAPLRVGVVGRLEPGGRAHGAVAVPAAALDVAGPVQGGQHLLGELGALTQDRLDDVRGGVGEPGEIVAGMETQHVVEQEQRVVDRCAILRHLWLSPRTRTSRIGPSRRLHLAGPRAPGQRSRLADQGGRGPRRLAFWRPRLSRHRALNLVFTKKVNCHLRPIRRARSLDTDQRSERRAQEWTPNCRR